MAKTLAQLINADFKRLQFACDNNFVYNPNARDCWISVNDGDPICIPAGRTVTL